ncbi:MAG: TIGR00295 family protein [Candidatus Altiarchaeota archaeon]|nr:TIGR00295 family protein [Candidatus Altiarchaeota archaeon]
MTPSTGYSKRKATKVLTEFCERNVIEHSMAVSEYAVEIAGKVRDSGREVDVDSVEIGALLHDIGRCKSHGIDHGIMGAKILEKIPDLRGYSRYCLTHIGAGISREEALELGLPPGDYIPSTLEEKIVAYADNITEGCKKVDVSVTLEKMKKALGENHPAIARVKELNDYITPFL